MGQMNTTAINIFRKNRNDSNGKQFMSYSTKLGKNATYYQVRFTTEFDDNMQDKGMVIPKGTKPFVINVLPTDVSIAKKDYKTENGETFEIKILYVRNVQSFSEYNEEPVDFDNL